MQANIKALPIPIFKASPALCSPINSFLLIRIIILTITKGNTKTLKTCVKICALIGLTPKTGTVSPIKQARPVNTLNCVE